MPYNEDFYNQLELCSKAFHELKNLTNEIPMKNAKPLKSKKTKRQTKEEIRVTIELLANLYRMI
jgi:hypothetical protein